MKDRRPDFELMSDEKYVIKIPAGIARDFAFKTYKDCQNDIHYVGIFVDAVSQKNKINTDYFIKFLSRKDNRSKCLKA